MPAQYLAYSRCLANANASFCILWGHLHLLTATPHAVTTETAPVSPCAHHPAQALRWSVEVKNRAGLFLWMTPRTIFLGHYLQWNSSQCPRGSRCENPWLAKVPKYDSGGQPTCRQQGYAQPDWEMPMDLVSWEELVSPQSSDCAEPVISETKIIPREVLA